MKDDTLVSLSLALSLTHSPGSQWQMFAVSACDESKLPSTLSGCHSTSLSFPPSVLKEQAEIRGNKASGREID